jgi:hypothetical protein
MKFKRLAVALAATGALSLAGVAPVHAVAVVPYADVVVVVDESGSMSTEHAWISGMISALDSGLVTDGLTPNQYGLTGFGSGSGNHATGQDGIFDPYVGGQGSNSGHKHGIDVAGQEFGTAAQFGAATAGLVLSGATEDGYTGITVALGYSYRSDAAKNIILVTDEDRDNTDASLNYASMLGALQRGGFLLNAVVNNTFFCGNDRVLGVNGSIGNLTGYLADGSGGYTSCAGATIGTGAGTTTADYVNLALAAGGAAWDLNLLRAGGDDATSFTNAFVDIKIQEIKQPPTGVPEPGTLALVGLALAGIAFRARKMH